jgi:hypothetical protein
MLEFLLQAALGQTKTFPLLATAQILDQATRLRATSSRSPTPRQEGCSTTATAFTAVSAQVLEAAIAPSPAAVACKHKQASPPLLMQPERSQQAAFGSAQPAGVLPRTAGLPAGRGEPRAVSLPVETLAPFPALDPPSAYPVSQLPSTDSITLIPNLMPGACQPMLIQPSSGFMPNVSITQVLAESLPVLPIPANDTSVNTPAFSTLQASVRDPESEALPCSTTREVLAQAPPLERLYGVHDALSGQGRPGPHATSIDMWPGWQHDGFPMPDVSATSAEVAAVTEEQFGPCTGSAARATELPTTCHSSERRPATKRTQPSSQQPLPKRQAMDVAAWDAMFEQLSEVLDREGRMPRVGLLGDWASQQLKEARHFFKRLRVPASTPSALTNDQYLKLTAIPAFLSELSHMEQWAQMMQLDKNCETSCIVEADRCSVPIDKMVGLEHVGGAPLLAEDSARAAEQSRAHSGGDTDV